MRKKKMKKIKKKTLKRTKIEVLFDVFKDLDKVTLKGLCFRNKGYRLNILNRNKVVFEIQFCNVYSV